MDETYAWNDDGELVGPLGPVGTVIYCRVCRTRYFSERQVEACAQSHALDRFATEALTPGASALDKCADAGCRHWRSMHVVAKHQFCAAKDCECTGFLEPKKLGAFDPAVVERMIAALRKPGEGAKLSCRIGLHFYSRFDLDRTIEIMGSEYASRACQFCGAESLAGWWKRCQD
jgi:hypothetical protein